MKWLSKIADELTARHPSGEIVISSGVSPSGKYHLGTLREILTAEAIARELRLRQRTARHIHVVDDLDVFRKVPSDVPSEFASYLGKPLCDVPSPDGSQQTYADYYVSDLGQIAAQLKLDMDIVRAHERYREGFFVPAIERALARMDEIKDILASVSGHKVDKQWSPVQIIEEGYLKTRQFVSLDSANHSIKYLDSDGREQSVSCAQGKVKLNWRIDWPARWWLLGVQAEPFGRDHATKGGSYDTGQAIARQIFETEPPLPLPYHFINRVGETKKISKSSGNVVTAVGLLDIMPPEIIWFFMLRYSPDKQLFFDEGESLIRLFDDFSALLAKSAKTPEEEQLLALCLLGIEEPTISNVPFSHLVASFQASLKDPGRTLELIGRTEHAATARDQANVIRRELTFINNWLERHAPDEVKFELREQINAADFDDQEKDFLSRLAEKISQPEAGSDGEWFHARIYELKDELNLEPKQMFEILYRALIGQSSGPRAGWFLSVLDPEWLVKRLRLEA